jgi:ZIP family zinc transporter
MSTYLVVMLLAAVSGATTLIGVALAIYVGRQSRYIAFGIGFSTGIMLLISVLELIPEAWAKAGGIVAALAVLAGGGFIALLHWIIPHTHLVDEQGAFGTRALRTAYLVMIGLVLHDVPEGFAMANAYLLSPSLGVLVSLGIALHNIPEEFAIAVPAVATRQRKMLFRAAIFSALAEPVGAAAGLLFGGMLPALTPVFLGGAAGAMIFVSVHELIPMARTYRQGPVFVLGVGASVLVYLALTLVRS